MLSKDTGLAFRPAANSFEAMANRDAAVEASGVLKTVAISLSNIANNIRWLASGPRCGIGEIKIPELQPGSSIMPGKVNPVIPEAVMMVAAQVVGNDATIAWANALGSNFDLNVMMPVIAYNLLQSIELLANAAQHLADKCVDARKHLEGKDAKGVTAIEADAGALPDSDRAEPGHVHGAWPPGSATTMRRRSPSSPIKKGSTSARSPSGLVGKTPEEVEERLHTPGLGRRS